MGEQEAKRLLATGERVLTRVRDERNKLQDAHTQLGEELKDVRAQLADSVKENKRLRGDIFSMCTRNQTEAIESCEEKCANLYRVY